MFQLETNRLILREFNTQDASSFYKLNSNPEVLKYTGDSAFKTVLEAQEFIKNYQHYSKYEYGRWAVLLKESNTFIGWCGLKYTPEKEEVDIGFRFFQEFWNCGFATEAAIACIDYGFQKYNISLIIGRAMKENKASVKVLEKIGLKFEREFDFDGNEGVIYAKTNL
ncbi:MAG: GNAT family N-acetyltransferase [Flavobacteriia bacterium]|nr:GNAT family N-acetyltransferase [Flavobacteriia bacterium]